MSVLSPCLFAPRTLNPLLALSRQLSTFKFNFDSSPTSLETSPDSADIWRSVAQPTDEKAPVSCIYIDACVCMCVCHTHALAHKQHKHAKKRLANTCGSGLDACDMACDMPSVASQPPSLPLSLPVPHLRVWVSD